MAIGFMGLDALRESEEKTSPTGVILSTGVGLGLGALTYKTILPWAFTNNFENYPRLQQIRDVGSKYGIRMLTANVNSVWGLSGQEMWSALKASPFEFAKQAFLTQAIYGGLRPTTNASKLQTFEGIVYRQGGNFSRSEVPLGALSLNMEDADLWTDKYKSYQKFKELGIEKSQPLTLSAKEFYEFEGDKVGGISSRGQRLINKSGGLENVVVKEVEAARGTGVWLNAATLPSDVAERIIRSPGDYILQEKIKLAQEYRVVLAGGKAVHTTYRFGSERTRSFFEKFLGYKPQKELAQKTGQPILNPEIIEPVFNKQTRRRIESFAEGLGKRIPNLDVYALDIGMTDKGVLKVIELQRSFGNISNPVVTSRLESVLTGRPSWRAMRVGGYIGITAATMVANLFQGPRVSSRDDDYNTIEALGHKGVAQHLRKGMTDFGSGSILRMLSASMEKSAVLGMMKNAVARPNTQLGAEILEKSVGWFEKTGGSFKQVAKDAMSKELGATTTPIGFTISLPESTLLKIAQKDYSKLTWAEQKTVMHELFEAHNVARRLSKIFGSETRTVQFLKKSKDERDLIKSVFSREQKEIYKSTFSETYGSHVGREVIGSDIAFQKMTGGLDQYVNWRKTQEGIRATMEGGAETIEQALYHMEIAKMPKTYAKSIKRERQMTGATQAAAKINFQSSQGHTL